MIYFAVKLSFFFFFAFLLFCLLYKLISPLSLLFNHIVLDDDCWYGDWERRSSLCFFSSTVCEKVVMILIICVVVTSVDVFSLMFFFYFFVTFVWFWKCSYQVEALEKAMKRNTIVYLETGSGKTLIAIMLLRSYAYLFRKPSPCFSVFLVPQVVLVTQVWSFPSIYSSYSTYWMWDCLLVLIT